MTIRRHIIEALGIVGSKLGNLAYVLVHEVWFPRTGCRCCAAKLHEPHERGCAAVGLQAPADGGAAAHWPPPRRRWPAAS